MKKLLMSLCVFALLTTGCNTNQNQIEETVQPETPAIKDVESEEVAGIPEEEQGKMAAGDIYSEALDFDWNYSIYLPKGYDEQNASEVDVIYLLHGAWGNHRNLVERFPIKDQLDELIYEGKMEPTVAVFVDGFNSYYVDSHEFNMETAIIKDLVPAIEEKYNIVCNREERGIGGISMGGYGAASLALKHPDVFSNAILISPAVWYDMSEDVVTGKWHVFVENGQFSKKLWDENHPSAFIESYKEKEMPVNFYIISGEKDPLVDISVVDQFAEELKEATNVTYVKESEGIHAWTFWEGATKKALEEYK